MSDVLLNDNDELIIRDGDFVIGDSETQEVSLILRMNPGELKEDPLLGPGLIRLIHSNATQADVQRKARLHLERDGKDYERIKQQIQLQ